MSWKTKKITKISQKHYTMYKNLEELKSKYKTIFDDTNHFDPRVNEILSRGIAL